MLAFALAGCSAPSRAEERRSQTVVVGVGSTVEQQVLAALTWEALRRAGVEVRLEQELGSTPSLRRNALIGSIDAYWDYTGAAWSLGRGEQAPPADPAESWERISRADEDTDLIWLRPSAANATLGFVVRAEDLPPRGAQRGMTWLAQRLSTGEQRLCADEDFVRRPAGLQALAQEYAIALDQVEVLERGEEDAIAGVVAGECFAGLATATSGSAARQGLVAVTDDLRVFPAFIVAPVVREGSTADRSRVRRTLEAVAGLLDTATLARLNAGVEAGREPRVVAGRFLDRMTAEATDSQ